MDMPTLLSFGPQGWGDDLMRGAFVTLSLALATLPLGLVAGFGVALAKDSSEQSLRLAGEIYTTVFRGLPELLTLLLVYYGAQIALQAMLRPFAPNVLVDINSFVAGMVALGVVFSSYASEVFLAAMRAIPRGQHEGAFALGLSRAKTMRLVILPQLIRIALPGLGNLWLNLLKDTALVSVIGLADIVRQASVAARVTKHAFLFFSIACLLYLALAVLSSIGLSALERRARGKGGTA